MTPEAVTHIVNQALMAAFWVALPLLVIGFLAGLALSLLQIVTSIQDSAFSTVPRLIVFLGGIILLMPWMLKKMTAYTLAILGDLGRYAR